MSSQVSLRTQLSRSDEEVFGMDLEVDQDSIVLAKVLVNSPASKSPLKAGDKLVSVNDIALDSADNINRALKLFRDNNVVSVEYSTTIEPTMSNGLNDTYSVDSVEVAPSVLVPAIESNSSSSIIRRIASFGSRIDDCLDLNTQPIHEELGLPHTSSAVSIDQIQADIVSALTQPLPSTQYKASASLYDQTRTPTPKTSSRGKTPTSEVISLISDDEEEAPLVMKRKREDDVDVVLVDKKKTTSTSSSTPARSAPTSQEDDDDIEFIGGSFESATQMPHQREACSVYPFLRDTGPADAAKRRDGNIRRCDFCYCYICDAKATECPVWSNHCNASYKNAECRKEKELMSSKILKSLSLKDKAGFWNANRNDILVLYNLYAAPRPKEDALRQLATLAKKCFADDKMTESVYLSLIIHHHAMQHGSKQGELAEELLLDVIFRRDCSLDLRRQIIDTLEVDGKHGVMLATGSRGVSPVLGLLRILFSKDVNLSWFFDESQPLPADICRLSREAASLLERRLNTWRQPALVKRLQEELLLNGGGNSGKAAILRVNSLRPDLIEQLPELYNSFAQYDWFTLGMYCGQDLKGLKEVALLLYSLSGVSYSSNELQGMYARLFTAAVLSSIGRNCSFSTDAVNRCPPNMVIMDILRSDESVLCGFIMKEISRRVDLTTQVKCRVFMNCFNKKIMIRQMVAALKVLIDVLYASYRDIEARALIFTIMSQYREDVPDLYIIFSSYFEMFATIDDSLLIGSKVVENTLPLDGVLQVVQAYVKHNNSSSSKLNGLIIALKAFINHMLSIKKEDAVVVMFVAEFAVYIANEAGQVSLTQYSSLSRPLWLFFPDPKHLLINLQLYFVHAVAPLLSQCTQTKNSLLTIVNDSMFLTGLADLKREMNGLPNTSQGNVIWVFWKSFFLSFRDIKILHRLALDDVDGINNETMRTTPNEALLSVWKSRSVTFLQELTRVNKLNKFVRVYDRNVAAAISTVVLSYSQYLSSFLSPYINDLLQVEGGIVDDILDIQPDYLRQIGFLYMNTKIIDGIKSRLGVNLTHLKKEFSIFINKQVTVYSVREKSPQWLERAMHVCVSLESIDVLNKIIALSGTLNSIRFIDVIPALLEHCMNYIYSFEVMVELISLIIDKIGDMYLDNSNNFSVRMQSFMIRLGSTPRTPIFLQLEMYHFRTMDHIRRFLSSDLCEPVRKNNALAWIEKMFKIGAVSPELFLETNCLFLPIEKLNESLELLQNFVPNSSAITSPVIYVARTAISLAKGIPKRMCRLMEFALMLLLRSGLSSITVIVDSIENALQPYFANEFSWNLEETGSTLSFRCCLCALALLCIECRNESVQEPEILLSWRDKLEIVPQSGAASLQRLRELCVGGLLASEATQTILFKILHISSLVPEKAKHLVCAFAASLEISRSWTGSLMREGAFWLLHLRTLQSQYLNEIDDQLVEGLGSLTRCFHNLLVQGVPIEKTYSTDVFSALINCCDHVTASGLSILRDTLVLRGNKGELFVALKSHIISSTGSSTMLKIGFFFELCRYHRSAVANMNAQYRIETADRVACLGDNLFLFDDAELQVLLDGCTDQDVSVIEPLHELIMSSLMRGTALVPNKRHIIMRIVDKICSVEAFNHLRAFFELGVGGLERDSVENKVWTVLLTAAQRPSYRKSTVALVCARMVAGEVRTPDILSLIYRKTEVTGNADFEAFFNDLFLNLLGFVMNRDSSLVYIAVREMNPFKFVVISNKYPILSDIITVNLTQTHAFFWALEFEPIWRALALNDISQCGNKLSLLTAKIALAMKSSTVSKSLREKFVEFMRVVRRVLVEGATGAGATLWAQLIAHVKGMLKSKPAVIKELLNL